MAKKKRLCDYQEDIIDRLVRLEEKLDKRMDNHSERLRSLEGFRAFTRGVTAIVVTCAGVLTSIFTGTFK